MSVMRSTGPARLALAAGLALFLAGCQQQAARPVSTTRLFATDQMGAAKSCTVSGLGAPAPGKEVEATMAVGNDGGWCGITVDNGGRPFAAGLLSVRPAHGRVFIHSVGDTTRIDYTPNPGFAGPDGFTVRLLPGEGTLRATVTVAKG